MPHVRSFDDSVVRAMRKWPSVPSCSGWLALDRRGRWRLQGELIHHERTLGFLNRNYRGDHAGRWFVQNGPQRVFVDLAAAPYCFRFLNSRQLVTHTEIPVAALSAVIVTDTGDLYLVSELGLGLLLDRDLGCFVSQLRDAAGASAEAELEVFIGDERSSLTLYWQGAPLLVRRGIDQALPQEFGFTRRPGA